MSIQKIRSKYPLNLVLRFFLELAAILSFGIWGYNQSDGGLKIIFAIFLPLGFALLWGVFAVKGDPSRSGKTVVQTPGVIRLVLELAFFGTATWMLLDLDYSRIALVFGIVIVLHYLLSFDRMAWLLKQK